MRRWGRVREIIFLNVSAFQALIDMDIRVLGLRSRCSLQPRLSHCGLSALGCVKREARLIFFHHSPFAGANDEKSGFVWAGTPGWRTRPRSYPGLQICRSYGALFWRLREGWDFPDVVGRRVEYHARIRCCGLFTFSARRESRPTKVAHCPIFRIHRDAAGCEFRIKNR